MTLSISFHHKLIISQLNPLLLNLFFRGSYSLLLHKLSVWARYTLFLLFPVVFPCWSQHGQPGPTLCAAWPPSWAVEQRQQRHLTFLSSHEDNAHQWNPALNPVSSTSHRFADIWSAITFELILTGLARATSLAKMYSLLFKTRGIFEFLKIIFPHCKTVPFFFFLASVLEIIEPFWLM